MNSVGRALGAAVLVAVLATVAGCGEGELQLAPAEFQGADGRPAFIRIFDAEGGVAVEWAGRPAEPIGWTRGTELLIFRALTWEGESVLAGDPASGELYLAGDLASEAVRPDRSRGYPGAAGEFRVGAGGVRRDDDLILPDRGFEHILLESPSGDWFAAIERPRAGDSVVYSIDPASGEIDLVRIAGPDEPRPEPERHWGSPDGRWVANIGPQRTILHQGSFNAHTIPIGSAEQPIWKPDGIAFLLNTIIGVVIVDVGVDDHGGLRVLLRDGGAAIIGWEGDRVRWLAHGAGG